MRVASDCYQDQLLTSHLPRTRVHCIRLRTGASTLATTSRFATPRSAACRSPFTRSLRSPPRSSPKVLPRYRLAYILAPSMDGYAFAGWRDLCLFLLALSALVSASCNFPRDPRGTLEGVQNATMHVGIVDNDPWTRMEDGRASGFEVELLKDFARELGADTTFVPGTTPELLEAAKEAEVDVLVGGFTSTHQQTTARTPTR